jgi:hypothetical protein
MAHKPQKHYTKKNIIVAAQEKRNHRRRCRRSIWAVALALVA